ncbi:MAG TPA: hydrogenase iron-sulfur subunit [Dehalococcoidia bacterium]|nr:hydrogenase iron-sulfur subunit [Dehalococcoidia bacterium]
MSKQAPNIVIFACNWDGLSCVEAASQAGYCYPASVKVVRVSCLSRIHQGLILKAFELGADGVILLGCEPGNCHFDIDAGLVTHEYENTRSILNLLGLGEERLVIAHLAHGDGYGFMKQVTGFITEVEQMQPAIPVKA